MKHQRNVNLKEKKQGGGSTRQGGGQKNKVGGQKNKVGGQKNRGGSKKQGGGSKKQGALLNVVGLYVKDPCDLYWCGKQLPPGTPESYVLSSNLIACQGIQFPADHFNDPFLV